MDDPGMFWWLLASGGAAIYCIARAVVDLRQRRYFWGALGIVSAAVLLLTPIKTHAVKIDLPVSTG
jgi:hypothetical protein